MLRTRTHLRNMLNLYSVTWLLVQSFAVKHCWNHELLQDELLLDELLLKRQATTKTTSYCRIDEASEYSDSFLQSATFTGLASVRTENINVTTAPPSRNSRYYQHRSEKGTTATSIP